VYTDSFSESFCVLTFCYAARTFYVCVVSAHWTTWSPRTRFMFWGFDVGAHHTLNRFPCAMGVIKRLELCLPLERSDISYRHGRGGKQASIRGRTRSWKVNRAGGDRSGTTFVFIFHYSENVSAYVQPFIFYSCVTKKS
jgi:hypothetical protein